MEHPGQPLATVFEVVRMYDPVVVEHNDGTACGVYARDRDMATLNIPQGAKPVIFRCRVLTRDQRRRVREMSSQGMRFEAAFRFGLVEVRNIPRDGGRLEDVVVPRAKAYEMISDETLDALGAAGGENAIAEIGGVVYARSFLDPGSPLCCPLLDSSAAAYGAEVSRHVAPKDGETRAASSGG